MAQLLLSVASGAGWGSCPWLLLLLWADRSCAGFGDYHFSAFWLGSGVDTALVLCSVRGCRWMVSGKAGVCVQASVSEASPQSLSEGLEGYFRDPAQENLGD